MRCNSLVAEAAIYSENEIMITCKEYWAISGEGSFYYRYTLLWDYFKTFKHDGHKTDEQFDTWWDKAKGKIR